MDSQKLDSELQLALSLSENVREESLELDVGYNAAEERWTLIVRYIGDIVSAAGAIAEITLLLGGYAIVRIREQDIEAFSALEQVIYVEKPRQLQFAVRRGKISSCFLQVQSAPYQLYGKGVLVGIVDSGIDFFHPDFRNPDGSTRLVELWDQTVPGMPPEGYKTGRLYTKEEINELLLENNTEFRRSLDPGGHGTAVSGIVTGNGQENIENRGAAWQSDILFVKLGTPVERSFPRTSELMTAVDYMVKTAARRGQPIAVNISFGNNYGSHNGDSVLSSYLDIAADYGRNVICIGTGNEGDMAHHASGIWEEGRLQVTELAVQTAQTAFNVQLFMQYEDQVVFALVHPDGQQFTVIDRQPGTQKYRLGDTQVYLYYGEPTPYSRRKELYLAFVPNHRYVDSGIWRLVADPRRIVTGQYDLWLPAGAEIQTGTAFLSPDPDRTFTEPSGTSRSIAVAAYDASTLAYAPFSGRGFPGLPGDIQPTLAAPGVNITTTRAGGAYTMVTGTSFATPFVTGAAALLMEWGIIRGNDPYLYGQKVKSYLISGARPLPGISIYPDRRVGYGRLCLESSLPSV